MSNETMAAAASEGVVSTPTQHTPGPWTWWTSNSWMRLKHDSRGVSMNVLEPYVCRDGHPDLDVSEANARLIAAAPDMLAALNRLLNDSMYKDHPEASQMAIDAIAKATGAE